MRATMAMFETEVMHKSGHMVVIDEAKNRVEIHAPDGSLVVLDKCYRWCKLCDGVRPLAQWTWRAMGDTGQLRTQPYCERHQRHPPYNLK